MVCVSCFVIPICIWVWFQFILPIITRLKALVYPGKEENADLEKTNAEKKKEFEEKLQCPFKSSQANPEVIAEDSKKIL